MEHSQRIKVQRDSGKTSFTLPARRLGKVKLLGWIPLLFGVAAIVFGMCWISFVWGFQANVGGQGPVGLKWILLVFNVVGLLPCFTGVKLAAAGIATLCDRTHAKIVLSNGSLVVFEKFFVFSFKRKVSLLNVSQLSILKLLDFRASEKFDESDGERKLPEFLTNLVPDDCCVLATDGNKSQLAVLGYTEEVALQAGDAIQAELKKVVSLPGDVVVIDGVVPDAGPAKPMVIEVVNLVSGQRGAAESIGEAGAIGEANSIAETETEESKPAYQLPNEDLQLPPESSISVSQKDGSDVYQVPAPGFRKSPLLVVGLLWNALLTPFTVLMVFILFKPNNPQQLDGLEILGVLALLGVFWVVGVGLLLLAWDMARRSVMIGVTGPLMFIETKGAFRTKWVEFDRKQISSIAVRDSNTSVNDKPVRHLVVDTIDNKTHGMFNNLEEDELQWLAARLRKSLNLTFKSRLNVKLAWREDGTLIVPEATRIKAYDNAGETVIEIPRGKLLHQIWNLVGTLLALAFLSIFIYVGITEGVLMFIVIPSIMAVVVLVMGITGQILLQQRWWIQASRQRLTLERRGLLSVKNYEVDIDQLKKVALHSTGWAPESQKKYEIRVHRNDTEEKIKLLKGWSIVELRYFAGLVLEATGRKPQLDETPTEDV